MLDYPLSVFIDTNIIINAKYDFTEKGTLYKLVSLVNDNKIKVYLHDIVIGEVKQHIEKDIANIITEFRKTRNEALKIMSNNAFEESIISEWFKFNKNSVIKNHFIENFNKYIGIIDAEVLNSSNIDVNKITSDFFAFNPPFENKDNKRYEFPDAIMAYSIKNHFSIENPVYIISNDNGFEKAFGDEHIFCFHKNIKSLLDAINKDTKRLYDNIFAYANGDNLLKVLTEKIVNEIENSNPSVDGTEYDRKGLSEGFEYDETNINHVSLTDIKLSSVDNITSDNFTVTYNCTANISADCTLFDESNSVWDSEDNYYIIESYLSFHEVHSPNFYCSVEFDIIDDEMVFEFNKLLLEISLDEHSRIERELIDNGFTKDDYISEEMDAFENHYMHNL